MVDETSQQIIRVYTDTAPRTFKELYHLMSWASRAASAVSHRAASPPVKAGEMNMVQLNHQGRPLENIVFRDDKLDTLRDALRQYGVDYSVVPSTDRKGVEVWFKSQDLNRIESAVQYVNEKLSADIGEQRPSLNELLDAAKKDVIEHNASIPVTPEKAHKKDIVL